MFSHELFSSQVKILIISSRAKFEVKNLLSENIKKGVYTLLKGKQEKYIDCTIMRETSYKKNCAQKYFAVGKKCLLQIKHTPLNKV